VWGFYNGGKNQRKVYRGREKGGDDQRWIELSGARTGAELFRNSENRQSALRKSKKRKPKKGLCLKVFNPTQLNAISRNNRGTPKTAGGQRTRRKKNKVEMSPAFNQPSPVPGLPPKKTRQCH